MRCLTLIALLLVVISNAFAAEDLSFTQRTQFDQLHATEVIQGKKAATKEWNRAARALPADAYDSKGVLLRDHSEVVRAQGAYDRSMADVNSRAQANHDSRYGAFVADSQSGVNALRTEKKRLQVEAFNKYEAQLIRNADGTTDKTSKHFKKMEKLLAEEWTRIDAEIDAVDAAGRREVINKHFKNANGDNSYKVVGELPGHHKSDADMMMTDEGKFKEKIKGLKESGVKISSTDFSDRNVDVLNDFSTWKDTTKGNKGRKGGSSSNDAEMAFGAQQGSDSFPTSDGKRYAAGAKKYNKLNAFNSNLVKLTHSVGDVPLGSVSYQTPQNVDFKTFAKSTVKGAGIANVNIDKNLGVQLEKLQKGKILEESLSLFGDSPAQKDSKVKSLLEGSKKVARKSFKEVEKLNSAEQQKLAKNVEILKRNDVAPERIAKAEERLLKNKSLSIENRGVYSELVTINPELVGNVISDGGKVVRKTNGEFVDTKDGRLLSSSEVREHYLKQSNAQALEASPFADIKKFGTRAKAQLDAVTNSKTFKAVSGSYNVIELGVSAVKGAQRAVEEEQAGDSDLKTYSKAMYYASPVAGINDLTKAGVFQGLTNYRNELALSNTPNDTTTQALLLGKHATIELVGAAGTLAKESFLGVIDTGKSLGSFAEWATRGPGAEKSQQNMDVMERKLISYRAKHLNGLYEKAKALRSDDAEGLAKLNKAVADTIKQWKPKKNAQGLLGRAEGLQNLLREATPARTEPKAVAVNAADPFGGDSSTNNEADPFGNEASSGEVDPFGDISEDIFADVDQNEVYRLKQLQATHKNQILQTQRSAIRSEVHGINEAHRRSSAALAAAAQSIQQTLMGAQIQLNNVRAQERAQDMQNRQIANDNKAAIYAMTNKNARVYQPQATSSNGYPVTDPYAQRFQQQQAQAQQFQSQVIESARPTTRPQSNTEFAPSPFEEPASVSVKKRPTQLWAIIEIRHKDIPGAEYVVGKKAPCWIHKSDSEPLDKVSFYMPTKREGNYQFYLGYTFAVTVWSESYCENKAYKTPMDGTGFEGQTGHGGSEPEYGYVFKDYGPRNKEQLIVVDQKYIELHDLKNKEHPWTILRR